MVEVHSQSAAERAEQEILELLREVDALSATLDAGWAEKRYRVRRKFQTGCTVYHAVPDGTALIDGLALIEEVNEHFDLNLSDPHYDTLAGLVLGRLGRMAHVGDVIVVDGAELRVEAMDGLRIARVSLTRSPVSTSNPTSE